MASADTPTGARPQASGGGFLAAPGDVHDWRLVVLADTATRTGVLAALPGTAADVASRAGLDAHAVEVVLRALREWDVVTVAGDEFRPGPVAVEGEDADVLHHHARVIRRWSTALDDRLGGRVPEQQAATAQQRESWIRALAAGARANAPTLADHALARFPGARTVLDLAGGHGEYGLAFARRGLDVTLQDLPEMIAIVSAWPSLAGVTMVAGDVFEEVAAGPFDLVVVTGFTHTQPPERVAELLRRLHAVTAPGGGIVIQTFTRDDRPTGPIFAVHMLFVGGGADCHASDEYTAWLADAGYGDAERVESSGRTLILATA